MRTYRRQRGAAAIAPAPFNEYLADALVRGRELLLRTSGIACDDDGNLDLERARTAWFAHREAVLEFAAEHRPGRVIWAARFDEPPEQLNWSNTK